MGQHDWSIEDLEHLAQLVDVPIAQVQPRWPVAEAARRTGLSIDTLRWYERTGLIDPPARAGRQRRYSDLDVERIRFVCRLRETGMPVATIAHYVDLRAQGPATIAQRLEVLQAHRHELLRRQQELADNMVAIDDKIAYYHHLVGSHDHG